jgi:hypothetical protein
MVIKMKAMTVMFQMVLTLEVHTQKMKKLRKKILLRAVIPLKMTRWLLLEEEEAQTILLLHVLPDRTREELTSYHHHPTPLGVGPLGKLQSNALPTEKLNLMLMNLSTIPMKMTILTMWRHLHPKDVEEGQPGKPRDQTPTVKVAKVKAAKVNTKQVRVGGAKGKIEVSRIINQRMVPLKWYVYVCRANMIACLFSSSGVSLVF